jgi:hypothetical protein
MLATPIRVNDRAFWSISVSSVRAMSSAPSGVTKRTSPTSPARRRRPLGGVESLPIVGQLGEVGAAWIQRDAEGEERIGLRAHRFRHLLEMDQVELQARMALHAIDDVAPHQRETRRTNAH